MSTPSRRDRLQYWIRRYAPAEITATASSFLTAGLVFATTGSLALAAVGATIADNVGFYGVVVGRTYREQRLLGQGPSSGRRRSALVRTALLAVIEFGPAEVLGTFAVRPLSLYLVPTYSGLPLGAAWVVGSLIANVVFYLVSGLGHLLGRRLTGSSPEAVSPEAVPSETVTAIRWEATCPTR